MHATMVWGDLHLALPLGQYPLGILPDKGPTPCKHAQEIPCDLCARVYIKVAHKYIKEVKGTKAECEALTIPHSRPSARP